LQFAAPKERLSSIGSKLGRTHAITGDADDAVLLAEQIEGFDGFLGEADDPL
jgi:hypothetical protein